MFEKVKYIIAVIASIPTIVKAAEEAIPMSGKGKYKFELVVSIVQTILCVLNISLDFAEKLKPMIESLINKTVELFNDSGVFEKGSGGRENDTTEAGD